MSTGSYKTVNGLSEGLYKEKGSKFIGLCYPIYTDQEVKPIIEQLKRDHPGACHWCFAFRIGASGEQYRANDDGEPSGSAGKPILNQLLSADITNVLLVVVRYYGGTKLGVSGLINAYKEAAKEAVNNASVEERTICDFFSIELDYEQLGEIERIIKEAGGRLVNKKFDDRCHFEIALPIKDSKGFKQLFSLYRNVHVEYLRNG